MVDTDNDRKFDTWAKGNPDLSNISLIQTVWDNHQTARSDSFDFSTLTPDNKLKFAEILFSQMKSEKEGASPEEKTLAAKIIGKLEETAATPESDLERQSEEKNKNVFINTITQSPKLVGVNENWGRQSSAIRRSIGQEIQTLYNKTFHIKAPVTFGIAGHSDHNKDRTAFIIILCW